MPWPNEDTRSQGRTLADIRGQQLLLGMRRTRRWQTAVRETLGGSVRWMVKGWRGLAVLLAVPSFALATLSFFEVHPLWPWEQEAEPGIELSIRVAEQARPSIGVSGVALPEPSAYRKEVSVSEGTDLTFAVLIGVEPEFTEEELPLVLRVDLPKEESTEHVVRVSVEAPEGPTTEAASAVVRLQGEPACLIYLRDSAQFMATIEGPLLEKLPEGGGTSVLAEGLEDMAGLMSEWGVSKGVLLFQARTRESPQRSGDFVGRNRAPCLPASFGQVALLD